MKRESIIRYGISTCLVKLSPMIAFGADSQTSVGKPNVLVIITDQQHAGMLSCVGNQWLKTPNMDRLAAEGVRFERAYCANPACGPSRFSIFTGRLPSVIGQEGNLFSPTASLPKITMGTLFRQAGYRTVYGGKRHLAGWGHAAIEKEGTFQVPAESKDYGFDELLTEDCREKLAQSCAQFFRQKQDRPFLLVASFINPHDICFMAIEAWNKRGTNAGINDFLKKYFKMGLPEGEVLSQFIETNCPPLPANWEIPENEPKWIMELDSRPFRAYVRQNWSANDWRLHRWAYARLTERVDAEIGKLLDGLRESGLAENTLIVFTSDHGDMDSAHRIEHKSMPYEEAVRIPLIFSGKGVAKAGMVDRKHLVSNGLDMIPTLCDFAGIQIPSELKGHSVKPLVEGLPPADWRKELVIENENSRILHMGDRKYVIIAPEETRREEMLIDLSKDPGEMKNLAADPAYRSQLENARQGLRQWYGANGFALDSKYQVKPESAN